jgi:cytochrome c oxidase subunit II
MFWYEGIAEKFYLPVASVHGVETDFLFWLTTYYYYCICILHILIGIFVVNYKHKKDRVALFYPDNHKLELIWTVIPAIVLSVLVYLQDGKLGQKLLLKHQKNLLH